MNVELSFVLAKEKSRRCIVFRGGLSNKPIDGGNNIHLLNRVVEMCVAFRNYFSGKRDHHVVQVLDSA